MEGLRSTAISGVLVGYESKRHAYRIYHPESGKIFVSAQVQFDETTFPLEGTEEVGRITTILPPVLPMVYLDIHLLNQPLTIVSVITLPLVLGDMAHSPLY